MTAEQKRMYCARRTGKAIDRVIVLMPGEEKEKARKWARAWSHFSYYKQQKGAQK